MRRAAAIGLISICAASSLATPAPAANDRLGGSPAGSQVALFRPLDDPRRPLFASVRLPGERFGRAQRLENAPLWNEAVAANERGDAVATWLGDKGLVVAARPARSRRFGRPHRLAKDAVLDEGSVAVNERGDAVVAWRSPEDETLTSWRPAGGTFGTPQRAPLAPEFLALTDNGDALLVATEDRAEDSGNAGVFWATSDDGGAWTDPQALSSPKEDIYEFSAAASGRGGALVLWQDIESERWRTAERLPGEPFRPVGAPVPAATEDLKLALGDDGDALLTYTAPRDSHVVVRTRPAGGRWTRGQVLPKSGSTEQVAADDDGNAAVAYWTSAGVVGAYGRAGHPLEVVQLQRGPSEPRFPAVPELDGSEVGLAIGGGRATATWQVLEGGRIVQAAADFSSRGRGPRMTVASVSYMRIGPPSACRPRGSRTVKDNGIVRLYETGVPNADSEKLWACMYRRGAPSELPRVQVPELAGSFVAYPSHWTEYEGGEEDYAAIFTYDLSTDGIDSVLVDPYDDITDLVVSSRGSTAWIVCEANCSKRTSSRTHAVIAHSWGAVNPRPLARGTGIAPRSLTLVGTRLSWIAGGHRRYATLR